MQLQWSSHGGKHFPPANVPWADVVKGTASGPGKYKPGVDVERLERDVWQSGELVTNGKNWKVKEFPVELGASAGKASRWVRVEESGGTIHGHPIVESEYKKLIKPRVVP